MATLQELLRGFPMPYVQPSYIAGLGFPQVGLSSGWYGGGGGDGSSGGGTSGGIGFGDASEGVGGVASADMGSGWAEGSNNGGIGFGLSGNLSDVGLANAQSNAGMFGTLTGALASALGTVPGLVASLANNANMSGLQNPNFTVNPNNASQISYSQGWPTTSTFGLMAQNSAPIALANAILGLFGVAPISFVDNINLETEDASNIAMNSQIAQNMFDAMAIMQDMEGYANQAVNPDLTDLGMANMVDAPMGMLGYGEPASMGYGIPGTIGMGPGIGYGSMGVGGETGGPGFGDPGFGDPGDPGGAGDW